MTDKYISINDDYPVFKYSFCLSFDLGTWPSHVAF